MISNKVKALLIVTAVLVSFGAGRYYSQTLAVKSETITQVVEDSRKHVQTTTTTVKEPNGRVKTVKQTDAVSDTKTEVKKDAVTEVAKTPKTNISVLIGYDSPGLDKPYYGLSVTRQVLGSTTLGVWGINNGTIGLSIGVNF